MFTSKFPVKHICTAYLTLSNSQKVNCFQTLGFTHLSDKSAAGKQQASNSSGIGFNFTGDTQQMNEEPLKVALRENKEKDDLLKITDSRFEFDFIFISFYGKLTRN